MPERALKTQQTAPVAPLDVEEHAWRLISPLIREHAMEAAARALDELRKAHHAGSIRLLQIPGERHDLPAIGECAARLTEGMRHVIIFGTGGSSLGAQALFQVAKLCGNGGGNTRFHILDNLESPWLERVLRTLDLERTGFLVISKSGRTPETVVQAVMAIDMLKKAGMREEIPRRMLFITDPPREETDNQLRRLARDFGIQVVDHEPAVGGRYSVLTNVGLIPAAMFGLDPAAVRRGAQEVLEPLLAGAAPQELPAVRGAALHYALHRQLGIGIMVTMPYTSRLRLFGAWLQQLWAESLGKEGRGTQPVTAVGPVDQHSQLQLYLDGPNDKLFNIIHLAPTRESFCVPEEFGAYTDLAGYRICDLTHAQQRATTDSLIRRGRPVRIFRIDGVNEHTIGALFMHFMLETILTAFILGVNPFDQPAVEESKQLTRTYLSQMTGC
jgi:glucose-6-phosphate isomerase